MDSKEKWISEVENSLKGLQAAEVNPYLYSKIMNRMQIKTLQTVPAKLIWITAASLLLLTLLNFFAIKALDSSGPAKQQGLESVANQFMNTNSINYN